MLYIDERLLDFTVRSDSDTIGQAYRERQRGGPITLRGAALLAALTGARKARRPVSPAERAWIYHEIAETHLSARWSTDTGRVGAVAAKRCST